MNFEKSLLLNKSLKINLAINNNKILDEAVFRRTFLRNLLFFFNLKLILHMKKNQIFKFAKKIYFYFFK